MDDSSRVPFDWPATVADLVRHGIEPRDGLPLALYTLDATEFGDDPLVSAGLAEFDASVSRWFAKCQVDGLVHLSDLALDRQSRFKSAYDIRQH